MRQLPIQLYGRLLPREVIGVCYHMVSDRQLPHVAPLYAYKSPRQFEADLLYLKRNFRLLSFPELSEERKFGRGTGRSCVHISFDDGYAECFSVVRPLLLRHDIPCTFFVSTAALDNRSLLSFNKVALCLSAMRGLDGPMLAGLLRDLKVAAQRPRGDLAEFAAWMICEIKKADSRVERVLDGLCSRLRIDVEEFLEEGRPYMSTDQVRQLAAEGFTIGGHTRLHPYLGSMNDWDLVEAEIVESCRSVARITGAKRVPFAFPYDAEGVDRSRLRDMLQRYPFIGPLFGTASLSRDEPFIVNRMVVDDPSPDRSPAGRRGTNLPRSLAGAYLDELLRRVPDPSTAQPNRRFAAETGVVDSLDSRNRYDGSSASANPSRE